MIPMPRVKYTLKMLRPKLKLLLHQPRGDPSESKTFTGSSYGLAAEKILSAN